MIGKNEKKECADAEVFLMKEILEALPEEERKTAAEEMLKKHKKDAAIQVWTKIGIDAAIGVLGIACPMLTFTHLAGFSVMAETGGKCVMPGLFNTIMRMIKFKA